MLLPEPILLRGRELAHQAPEARVPDHVPPLPFGDLLADGKLHFDYTLRSGMVRQSYALELMRAVGLRV